MLLDAVRILELSGKWKGSDARQFLKWCRDYLEWLKTSKNGKEEFAAENKKVFKAALDPSRR